MKRYENSRFNHEKHQARLRNRERHGGGFRCCHCRQFVVINDSIMGTANRNHCNWCLWSKHVDESKGDRRSSCHGGMRPVGLTFKHEGYGRRGEIMVIHLCSGCQKLSINRVARDDPAHSIEEVFFASLDMDNNLRQRLSSTGIYPATKMNKSEVHIQLFGD